MQIYLSRVVVSADRRRRTSISYKTNRIDVQHLAPTTDTRAHNTSKILRRSLIDTNCCICVCVWVVPIRGPKIIALAEARAPLITRFRVWDSFPWTPSPRFPATMSSVPNRSQMCGMIYDGLQGRNVHQQSLRLLPRPNGSGSGDVVGSIFIESAGAARGREIAITTPPQNIDPRTSVGKLNNTHRQKRALGKVGEQAQAAHSTGKILSLPPAIYDVGHNVEKKQQQRRVNESYTTQHNHRTMISPLFW